MKLVSVFRKRLDGFGVRVQKSNRGLFLVTTEGGLYVAMKPTEREAAEVARRTAQAGRQAWEELAASGRNHKGASHAN